MEEQISGRKKLISVAVISLIALLFGGVEAARAATLYFSPTAGSYAVGARFPVSVYVSSADQAMNAASGNISFPPDQLEVVSLSKGPIFSLWVRQPTFSNALGSVDFEGIALNPGFTGLGGKLLTINFKTKAAGSAPLQFSSGSVLANDGKGTNILAGLGSAVFTIGRVQPPAPAVAAPTEIAGAPGAPAISSPTHPDPTAWYAASVAKFTWSVPPGTTGVRLLVGKLPLADPSVTYDKPISSKEVTDLTDGIWYFHVRLRNARGWGATAHFEFRIDTEKPSHFEMREVARADLTEPVATYIFDAADDTSGIDHYEIQIDNASSTVWRSNGSKPYQTPAERAGDHSLVVKALDKAGNYLENSATFTVQSLPAPEITEYPRTLPSGEILVVRGQAAVPNGQVNVSWQRGNENIATASVAADNQGNFVFTSDEKLADGVYRLWAQQADAGGAAVINAAPSQKVTITVEKPILKRFGFWAVNILSVIVPIVALLILLLFTCSWGWHKFYLLRKKIGKSAGGAEPALRRAFDLLWKDMQKQISILEKTGKKRPLSAEEEKIIKKLRSVLAKAERLIAKEIDETDRNGD